MSFIPQRCIIEDISQSNPCVITTIPEHGYGVGSYVRIIFYASYGMEPLNEQVFLITPITDFTFSIPVDTTNFNPFVRGTSPQEPQCVPVGEISNTLINATQNILVQS